MFRGLRETTPCSTESGVVFLLPTVINMYQNFYICINPMADDYFTFCTFDRACS